MLEKRFVICFNNLSKSSDKPIRAHHFFCAVNLAVVTSFEIGFFAFVHDADFLFSVVGDALTELLRIA